jgi:hypothetical protein
MRKYAFVVIALLVVGVIVGARAVSAQNDFPTGCLDLAYDVNGDGFISLSDGRAWGSLASQCLDQVNVPGFISPEACRALIGDAAFDRVDIDGDGDLDHDDGALIGNRSWECWPARTRAMPR